MEKASKQASAKTRTAGLALFMARNGYAVLTGACTGTTRADQGVGRFEAVLSDKRCTAVMAVSVGQCVEETRPACRFESCDVVCKVE